MSSDGKDGGSEKHGRQKLHPWPERVIHWDLTSFDACLLLMMPMISFSQFGYKT